MATSVMPANQIMINALVGNLREADNRECMTSVQITADQALQEAFDRSSVSWVGFYGPQPVLAFGVAPHFLTSDTGAPWLLATDAIEKVGMRVLRHSRKYVGEMLKHCCFLENYVDARNTVSIKWLKWCGFQVDEGRPTMLSNIPFFYFWLDRSNWGSE